MIDLTHAERRATEWLHAANRKAKESREAKDTRPEEKLAKVLADCFAQLPPEHHEQFCEAIRTAALAFVASQVQSGEE